jgi:hypothetical protein
MPNNKGTCKRPEEREAVRREAMRGLSIREIADTLDIPYDRASNHISHMMNHGLIPPAAQRKTLAKYGENETLLRNERMRRGIRYGNVTEVLRGMTPEQFLWLLDQVPKSGTLADIMRGIIVDAYEEESK